MYDIKGGDRQTVRRLQELRASTRPEEGELQWGGGWGTALLLGRLCRRACLLDTLSQ